MGAGAVRQPLALRLRDFVAIDGWGDNANWRPAAYDEHRQGRGAPKAMEQWVDTLTGYL
jgi:hypothetical protein